MPSTTLAVIPARMASSRFPGKPLAPIAGLSLIEHVRRRSRLSPLVTDAVVATCDRAIAAEVEGRGGRAVMTSDQHDRCTTRVAEAMTHLVADIVVIVQGDEPLLRPDMLECAIEPLLRRPEINCTNVLSPIHGEDDRNDSGIVKAAADQDGFIMFFSRAAIPFYQKTVAVPIYRQTGIMAFRPAFLDLYVALPETPFERAESVDMLRLLEHGHRILGVPTPHLSIGVDHPRDVARVEQVLRDDPEQRALHARIV